MDITILGNLGLYPCNGGATSGYLLKCGGANICFEMGSGVFSRLISVVLPEKLDALILSHLHFDHISDLGVLNYYLESLFRKGVLDKKLKLILPRVEGALVDVIKSMQFFELDFVENGDSRVINGVNFEFFNVKHPIACLGFKAWDNEKTFVYSGDTDLCDALEEKIKSANLVLADGAFLSEQYKEGAPHMSASLCSNLSKKYGVRFLVSHILPANGEEKTSLELEGNDLCVIAKEGETYYV